MKEFFRIWRKMKRKSAFFRFFCLFLSCCLFCSMKMDVMAEGISDYDLYASAAVLMDGDTGRVLYGKNEYEHLSNASTTKILTCILVLESGQMDEYACVSKLAASQPDVQADLLEGEYYLVSDLLYSLMLESHNDTAYVLAEHVGGSVEGFAERMNELAKKLGCTSSFFITPNGLDATDPDTGNTHGTSAHDLALIMRYCVFESHMREKFLEITEKSSFMFGNYVFHEKKGCYERGKHYISCVNHNALLGSQEGMISGKTGFTNQAGYCYVGAISVSGKHYIVSLLGCGWPPNKTYKWADARKLFSYGLSMYDKRDFDFGKIKREEIVVKGGIPDELSFEKQASCEGICQLLHKSLLLREDEELRVEIDFPKELEKTVHKGDIIGNVSYYIADDLMECVNIYADQTVLEKNDKWAVETVWKLFINEFVLFSDNL